MGDGMLQIGVGFMFKCFLGKVMRYLERKLSSFCQLRHDLVFLATQLQNQFAGSVRVNFLHFYLFELEHPPVEAFWLRP